MKKYSTAWLNVLYGLFFICNLFLFASNNDKNSSFQKTGPAATADQVNADFQKQFAGLFATKRLPQIRVPTPNSIRALAPVYGKNEAEKAENYYKQYEITVGQAQELYAKSGEDFSAEYNKIVDAKSKDVSVGDAVQAYLSGSPIVAKQPQQRPSQETMPRPTTIPDKPIEAPTGAQFGDSYYLQYGITAAQAQKLYQLSGNKFRESYNLIRQVAARDKQSISDALESKLNQAAQSIRKQMMVGQGVLPQAIATGDRIKAPTDPLLGDDYYKQYDISLDQAQRLYEATGKNDQVFKEAYTKIAQSAAASKQLPGGVLETAFKSMASGKNPLPGRPAKNIWTRSIFSYIPAGGGQTVESRADKLVYGTGRFIAGAIERPLGAISSPFGSHPEQIEKDGKMVANPKAGQTFTLLDAVDQILSNPLIRFALEVSIIGPLDKNKDLKMRQFIMILLVTHYNSYKLTMSPLGALNFAVSKILFPIRAASSAGQVSMFLMRQALTVFNQYNLNGGSLEQALSNQATNLVIGHAGTIFSGTKRVVSGVASKVSGAAGAVGRGIGSIFRPKK